MLAIGSLLLTSSLTSCANYVGCGIGRVDDDVVSEDLLGTYTGSEYGGLTFKPNGKLVYRDWEFSGGEHQGASGEGEWSFGRGKELDSVGLTLDYPQNVNGGGSYGLTLYVEGSANDLRLYGYLTDPDVCELNTFKREAELPVTP
ncbi:hypothetical protein [Streptomyces sp. AC512_CC834]|uniref:hypothetical protein n=1 Tax=Streptomyces sp. AC512_CC834 TaxID=2823691 RepID=UPI001C25873F|nr:hypothetical protein [Streptomyces sp. AC512_CC834]